MLDAPGGGPSPACVLGHTRLSIIDLSDASRQPMATADGRHALVYNGEVYNFAEIRRDLEALGETFASSGDSEVVLKALVRWGPAALERFRGMFALGLWDERDRTLLLARDRLGVKPLYVTSGAGGIAFSSEVRTLLAAGAAERVLSPRGLLGYMRLGSVPEPDTLIAGIRSVAPGTFLRYENGDLRESVYWTFPPASSGAIRREEAVDGVRAILHESVRLRLVSDVPFGIFLSGGVDSAVLTAIASAEACRPVHTFTVTFDEEALSEERWAAETASRFDSVHHSVRVTGSSAARDLPEALRAQDQPSGDGLNTWLVSRAARREGLSMALSGLGGDELFAGYPTFRGFGRLLTAARAASVAPAGLLRLLAGWAARPGSPNRLRKGVAIAQAGGSPTGVYEALRGHFTDAQVERLMPGPAFRRIMADSGSDERPPADGDLPVDDAVNAFSLLELSRYLRSRLLRDTDAMSMASSLEVRVPFLDHRLVELVLSLRGHLKLDVSVNKPLLLDAVPELPRETGARPKAGFVLPLPAWFRGPMKESMEELLLGLPGSSAGILRRSATTEAWRAFLRGDGTVSATRVFTLASLAAWTSEHDLILPW